MNAQHITALLNNTASSVYDVYERRPGKYQLIVPIRHDDGDMLDIYLQDSPLGEGYVRVCDYGLTLMRLSYTFDLTTDSQQRIFDSILVNNGVANDDGNLYLDVPAVRLNDGILQFASCVQKVCDLRYWNQTQ